MQFADERVGEFDTQLVEHTYQSLANNSGMTLHVRKVGRHRLASAREKEKLPMSTWSPACPFAGSNLRRKQSAALEVSKCDLLPLAPTDEAAAPDREVADVGLGGRVVGGSGDGGGARRGPSTAHGGAVRRAPRYDHRLIQGNTLIVTLLRARPHHLPRANLQSQH